MAKYRTRLDSDMFRWSEDEYTLRELIERFGHQLPFLVIATAGYLGIDEWVGGVATHEVQWLYGFAKQIRLVLMDEAGVYYSVPRCYQGYVLPRRSDGLVHRKMTVADVIDECKYTHLEFCDKRMSLKVKGPLKIIESYEERYLVGHVLSEGTLASEFTLTPCSVPLKLAVALTAKDGGQRTFFSLMVQYKDFIDQCPHDYTEALSQFSEVTVYKGTPQTGEYEYITSMPLLLASQLPDDPVPSAEKSHYRDPSIHTAYGISPDHRLGQLRHVFHTREIPEDDSIEVVDPEPPKRNPDKPKKSASKLTNLFKPKPKKPGKTVGETQTPAEQKLKPKLKPKKPGKTVDETQTPAEQKPKLKPKTPGKDVEETQTPAEQKPKLKPKPKKPGKNVEEIDTPTEQKPKPKQPRDRGSKGQCQQKSGDNFYESLAYKREFSSLSDVPPDLSTLTVNDVTKCLELLNLSRHKETFKNHLIDGQMLACLTESMLSIEFGFTEFEARQLSRFAKGYRPKLA